MAREVFVVTDSDDPSRAMVRSFTDDGTADPVLITRSDDSTWRFHWLKRNPNSQQGRPFIYGTRPNSFKVGAGVIDATPTGGTFTITGAAGGTTSALAYDVSAAAFQTAVRASLTGFTAAIVSLISTGVYEIDRGATTAVSDITANADGLVPSGSTVNITNIQNGTSLLNEKWQVRLRKALPFLHTTGSTAFDAALVAVTEIQAGSATAREIQGVAWNSDSVGGSVWLNVSTTGSDNKTVGPIAYNATAEAVKAAFAVHSALTATPPDVAQTGPGSYTITFPLAMAGTPTVATADNDLVVPVGDQCDISMETGGADAILLGEDEAPITFEIETRESVGKPRTIVRDTSAKLLADLLPNTPGTTDGENWATVGDVFAGRMQTATDTSDIPTTQPDFQGQLLVLHGETYKYYIGSGLSAGDWAGEVSALFGIFEDTETEGFKLGIVSKTTTYAATATDHTILCDATGGSFDVDLPAAASHVGRVYVIKKVNAANTVSVDPNGTELIDGSSTSVALTTQWSGIVIQSNGTSWFKIGTI